MCSTDLERIFKTLIDRGEQNGSLATLRVCGHREAGIKGSDSRTVDRHASTEGSGNPVLPVRDGVSSGLLMAAVLKGGEKTCIETICKVKLLKLHPEGMVMWKTLLNPCSVALAEDMWCILQQPGNFKPLQCGVTVKANFKMKW